MRLIYLTRPSQKWTWRTGRKITEIKLCFSFLFVRFSSYLSNSKQLLIYVWIMQHICFDQSHKSIKRIKSKSWIRSVSGSSVPYRVLIVTPRQIYSKWEINTLNQASESVKIHQDCCCCCFTASLFQEACSMNCEIKNKLWLHSEIHNSEFADQLFNQLQTCRVSPTI